MFSISFIIIINTLFFIRYVEITERNGTLLLEQCTMLSYTLVALKDYPYFPLIGLVIVPLIFGLLLSSKAIYTLRKKEPVGDRADVVKI